MFFEYLIDFMCYKSMDCVISSAENPQESEGLCGLFF